MTDIKQIKHADNAIKQVVGKNVLSSDLLNEFNSVFKEAAAAAAQVDSNEW